MMDPEINIPIAYGEPIPLAPPRDLRAASSINRGRSSRVVLPQYGQEDIPLPSSTVEMLRMQGYTQGLLQAIAKNKRAFPLSIWVVDNSGSMASRDGHRIVPSKRKNEIKFVDCTRWAEMQQTVDYHAQMAALTRAPTTFRLLNDPGRVAGPQQFSVGERGDEYIDEDLSIAQSTMMNSSPGGVTPLVHHLKEIRENVLALEPSLRANGTKVVIVLATDGIPTDDYGCSSDHVKAEFVNALRSLEGLPVWIVVRLCTDEDNVVEYWNSLDEQLELSLEVLDDFLSEAQEVHKANKWINYALPLHRMREMGFHDKVFDMLDERKLAKDEVKGFAKILFGCGPMDEAPDPEVDWDGFYKIVESLLAKEEKQWNPITKKIEPSIDLKKLRKEYHHGWKFW